jgi:hypothetical protein
MHNLGRNLMAYGKERRALQLISTGIRPGYIFLRITPFKERTPDFKDNDPGTFVLYIQLGS